MSRGDAVVAGAADGTDRPHVRKQVGDVVQWPGPVCCRLRLLVVAASAATTLVERGLSARPRLCARLRRIERMRNVVVVVVMMHWHGSTGDLHCGRKAWRMGALMLLVLVGRTTARRSVFLMLF